MPRNDNKTTTIELLILAKIYFLIKCYSILHYKPGKMVFTGEWRI
jgi:hypothetical protein